MKVLFFVFSIWVFSSTISAQNRWFETYDDSTLLVNDANLIVQEFAQKIASVRPDVMLLLDNDTFRLSDNQAIKNTTPFLIFIDSTIIHLPFWEEVIPPQKEFFQELAGAEEKGKEVFGLLFNGFFLAHELGHSFFAFAGKQFSNAYDSEYEANKLGILYWKSSEEAIHLENCYHSVKMMLTQLENPVPEGENYKEYITQHYYELAADPFKYGYIQFKQIVEIFEDQSLPDLESYLLSIRP